MLRTRFLVLACCLIFSIGFAPTVFSASLPDFMENWEFAIDVDEDEGPNYFADLIVPLIPLEEDDRVIFFEPRLSYQDSEYLLNLGWGYRQLVNEREWLLGANMFYDYDSQYSHYRLGWGVEALSNYAELRGNYYLGLSPRRLTEEISGTETYEEAVDGFDLEIGAPIPYYSQVKLFGGYNWYNYKTFKNRYGWTLRAEYKPLPYVVIDGHLNNDTKGNLDWGMTWAFKIPLGNNYPDSVHSPFRLDTEMFPESDMTDNLWVLVERHHEITVEAEQVSTGVNVEVVRNN